MDGVCPAPPGEICLCPEHLVAYVSQARAQTSKLGKSMEEGFILPWLCSNLPCLPLITCHLLIERFQRGKLGSVLWVQWVPFVSEGWHWLWYHKASFGLQNQGGTWIRQYRPLENRVFLQPGVSMKSHGVTSGYPNVCNTHGALSVITIVLLLPGL